MGNRVHVCKTYKIEYGSASGFNYNSDKFCDLLKLLGAEPIYVNEFDMDCECATGDYDDALSNLKAYIANPQVFEAQNDDDNSLWSVRTILNGLQMSPEELLDLMQRYRSEADVSDGYLHFSVF